MKFSVYAAVAALALSAGSVSASTIGFDTNNGSALSHGSFVDGRFDFGNGLTGTISTSGGSGTAQVFDTTETGTEDPDLEFPTAGLGNVLIVNEALSRVDDNGRGGVITFVFDSLVEFTGLTLVDFEERGSIQPMVITADGGFNSGSLFNGDNEYSQYSTTAILTRTLTFNYGGSGAIDNLQVSAVPLPASSLLLLGGLGGIAALRRRKKS